MHSKLVQDHVHHHFHCYLDNESMQSLLYYLLKLLRDEDVFRPLLYSPQCHQLQQTRTLVVLDHDRLELL